MEDALVLYVKNFVTCSFQLVLILVLMEDALVQITFLVILKLLLCLNPCFNGRCTSTQRMKAYDAFLEMS